MKLILSSEIGNNGRLYLDFVELVSLMINVILS